MQQKFTILKDKEKNQLLIQEFAELDRDILSLLCEEAYDGDTLERAVSEGEESLVAALRTKNMYPPAMIAKKIAQSVKELYESGENGPVDIIFNDVEMLAKEEPEEDAEDLGGSADEIDDLLEDDVKEVEDDYDQGIKIKKLKTSLKVADDEPGDADEDA